MARLSLFVVAATSALATSAEHTGAACTWPGDDPRCRSAAYAGPYPQCALYQWPTGEPIPCQGVLPSDACEFTGEHAGSQPPPPASYHVHILFPNSKCTNCTKEFSSERQHFSYAGAMALRGKLARALNDITQDVLGRPPSFPIDEHLAETDPGYDQCERRFHIVAGAPANYQQEPCIFSVDDDKKPGPFTDPESGLGYPNYSFLLPGHFWMPQLIDRLENWLGSVRNLADGAFSEYDVLIHPNTGCEVRDHTEERSIRWMGHSHPLLANIFTCKALGCNQACPRSPTQPEPLPANCSWALAEDSRLLV